MLIYAIRIQRTGEIIQTFSNPIEAELTIRSKDNPDQYEVVEQTQQGVWITFKG